MADGQLSLSIKRPLTNSVALVVPTLCQTWPRKHPKQIRVPRFSAGVLILHHTLAPRPTNLLQVTHLPR